MALKKEVPSEVKYIVNEYYRGPHIREIINEMDNEISYRDHYDLLRKMKEYGFTYKRVWQYIFYKSFHHFQGADPFFINMYARSNKTMVREIVEKILEVPPSSTLELLLIIVHYLRIDDKNLPKRRRVRVFELTKENLQPNYLLKLFKEHEVEASTSTPYLFFRQKNTVFQRKSKNRKKYSRSRKLGRKKSRRKRKSRSRRS
jgi:hypothetical protein